MKGYINRRSPSYHKNRIAGIEELDKIASTILATSYSRRTKQTFTSQSMIQFDCVAACVVNGGLWVASNSGKIEYEDLEPVFAAYSNTEIYVVTNGRGAMHAEMQLLMEIKGADFDYPSYMGVSKPCCIHCANVLDEKRIGYAHFHTDTVIHWENPF